MNNTVRFALVAAATSMLFAGCKKTADNTMNYRSAINAYYATRPVCLWSQPKQFPVQVGASDTDKNAPYAALVDQGLLFRTTSEKKIIIVSKQEINYDLTQQGRAAWTADTNQPGYGNFCYGTRSVQSLDSATPNSGQPGATTVVRYHYTLNGTPDWAKAAEMQTAFPQISATLAGGAATATLIDTADGWQMQAPPASTADAPGAGGKIVE
jgi:hypothetical protein